MFNHEKAREIKFTLEVTHVVKTKTGDPDNPLKFKLNLNPDDKLTQINETFSTKEDLKFIFNRINDILDIIDERGNVYAEATTINRDVLKKAGLSERAVKGEYDTNIKKPFSKIDRIIYGHHSPGSGTVSYGSSYNGDKPPTGHPKGDL